MSYCLHCRKKTSNSGKPVVQKDKRGKPYLASKCSVCGGKKVQLNFSSKQEGNGLFGRVLGGIGGSYFGPVGSIVGQELGSNLPF